MQGGDEGQVRAKVRRQVPHAPACPREQLERGREAQNHKEAGESQAFVSRKGRKGQRSLETRRGLVYLAYHWNSIYRNTNLWGLRANVKNRLGRQQRGSSGSCRESNTNVVGKGGRN